jgi:predicted transcriptional regulator
MINLSDLADEFAAPPAVSKQSIASKLKAALSCGLAVFVKSRQTRADQLVRSYLRQHDDAQLAHMGFPADQIANIGASTSRSVAGF